MSALLTTSTNAQASPPSVNITLLALLFFCSGAAALVYQVSWQRLLFRGFGSDLETISLIVATFMVGLGLGALIGGWLADRLPRSRVAVFTTCEIGIGLFGICSPWLIPFVADQFIASSRAVTGIVVFCVLVTPTCLMGATLPLLVTEVDRTLSSIGAATGLLYALNTLGAATGAAATVHFLFPAYGLGGTIYIACGVNFAIAIIAALALTRTRVRHGKSS